MASRPLDRTPILVFLAASTLAFACANATPVGGGRSSGGGDDAATSGEATGGPASGVTTGAATTGAATSGDPGSGATTGGEGGGATGQGGAAAATTTTGQGGSSSSATSGGGGAPGCAHDVCTEGGALESGCDPCVTAICDADSFCCDAVDGSWDSYCTGAVADLCSPLSCDGGSSSSTGGGGGLLPGDLVITEIMNNPKVVTDANGEWFEVHNTTASPIDMEGLLIRHDAVAAPHPIGASVVVPAGGYAVLGLKADAAVNGGIAVDYQYASSVSLGNSDDVLSIETAASEIIDATSWDGAGLDPDGASRSLDPAFLDAASNDDDTHFCEATSFVSGNAGDRATPGAANDPCP